MSTLTTLIKRFAAGLFDLIDSAFDTLLASRDAGSTIAQDVFRMLIYGTGGAAGVGGVGDMAVDDLGSTSNVYLHFKLPLTTADTASFRFNIAGYNYGASKVINVVFQGGVAGGVFTCASTGGSHTAGYYVDGSGNLVLRVYFPSIYYTTLYVHTQSNDDVKRIVRGQVQGKVSLSSQITF